MANIANNDFFASTSNEKDLKRIEAYLDENFDYDSFMSDDDYIEVMFYSRWEYPENLIDEMIASLEAPNELYIRVLSYDLPNEFVSFRVFEMGKWDIRA